ncbi:hypothetical protein [Sphingomonas hengshuiensis]|uniref:Uncharacterized protein n=1 Tax=Sphingomonas hengshuiensis TaxID=1609977 RepID=A0A7U4JBA8_9SPHN|nr:hypothetical protein [Sphingomonas hengshuiensis]AJP73666.1 hypothetical protein TS85_20510 [Sphingomonas hengshuiensis]
MLVGLTLAQLTELHVVISLVAIAAGGVFFGALALGRWWNGWNDLFLVFTVLTSVTGFFFPPKPIGPPFVFGVISLVALAGALYALYGRGAAGRWHTVYLVLALFAQWLNMVVLVVQSFQKLPALHALAPLGGEPPVLAAQVLVAALVGGAAWRTLWHPVPIRRG